MSKKTQLNAHGEKKKLHEALEESTHGTKYYEGMKAKIKQEKKESGYDRYPGANDIGALTVRANKEKKQNLKGK